MVSLSFTEITKRLRNTSLPETDLVIGIGTGGIVPACITAFHLGCELAVMTLNYRDDANTPKYEDPVIVKMPEHISLEGKKILLVDDVSVSGKTMALALKQLEGHKVKTLAMKGKADFVLFPDVKDCVKWPWKG